MARTALITDSLFLRHDPGRGHPESPQRLARTLEVLGQVPLEGAVSVSPRAATAEEIGRVHGQELVSALARLDGKAAMIDADTYTSPDSYRAAVLAAGAAVTAVEQVLGGSVDNAFALVRPPGHHAEPDRAMGFCLFNNAAIAAEHALAMGVKRVLIHDWDVHHGNGTQAAFYGRRDVLYQSVHQFPYYPGTGAAQETGSGAGVGYTVNCPLPGTQGDGDYGAVFQELMLPTADAFSPELVIVSAGFDAHEDDPIGGMMVTERGFAGMCMEMLRIARAHSGGRIVLLLEGGYSLPGLSRSVHACLEVLTGGRSEELVRGGGRETMHAITAVRAALVGATPGL